MFYNCSSITEINLGELDFELSDTFESMFYDCFNLERLDVSHLNTKNSRSFKNMFYQCLKLKEINVSKFKTFYCRDIVINMFYKCKSLLAIDMLKWDMHNINNIDYLFFNYSKLKSIKMNFNNDKIRCGDGFLFFRFGNQIERAFEGLPNVGSYIWKKGINCDNLLKYIPVSWNRTQEE